MTEPRSQNKRTRSARRAKRYGARSVLWRKSTLSRVRACGLHQRGDVDGITYVRTPDGAGGYVGGVVGVQSCGSTWACPVCSERIQAERQDEVSRALVAADALGWQVGFMTFTVRHSRRMTLAEVWAAVSAGWRNATSGSGPVWKADKDEFGVQGYIRLIEVTQGVNGWHVHVHALVFMDPAATLRGAARPGGRLWVEDVQDLGARMGERWAAGVTKHGKGFRPSNKHGETTKMVTTADVAAYFTKGIYGVKSAQGTASEVTLSSSKVARGGNRTPFQILEDVVDVEGGVDVDADRLKSHKRDLSLWAEWERTSKGKRQLLWSNGLRDLLGLQAERSDEEIAEDDALSGSAVCTVWPKEHQRLARRGLLPALLDALEKPDDGHAVYQLLALAGVPWKPPLTSQAS